VHVCPPVWWIEHKEWYGDELIKVYEVDEEEAAKRWAGESDSGGDYTIIGGSEETIIVYDNPGGIGGKVFEVSGEMVREYHAEEKKPEEKGVDHG